MRNLGSRGGIEPLIHRAAFVGLDVAEGDPAQSFNRNDSRNSLRNKREQCSKTGVEKQWFFGLDQELIERESIRRDARNEVEIRKIPSAISSVLVFMRSPPLLVAANASNASLTIRECNEQPVCYTQVGVHGQSTERCRPGPRLNFACFCSPLKIEMRIRPPTSSS